MEYGRLAGIAGGIVALAAFVPYIRAIIKGTTTPNRATWLIWTIIGCITAASYAAGGADQTIWVAVSYALGPFLVFALSLQRGEGGTTAFDLWCLVIAGVSLMLWVVFENPFIALVLSIAIDTAGSLPTFKKVWHAPYSEDIVAWSMFWSASVLNFWAIEAWSWDIALYPMYTLIGSTTMFILIVVLRRTHARPHL